MTQNGLFVGLITLDCIYQAERPPQANEKMVAQQTLLAAGGPATNAAVTFAQMGTAPLAAKATLLGALGQHPLAKVITDDLSTCQVHLVDLLPDLSTPPPMSSIVVSQGTGERAVISRNAVDRQIAEAQIPLKSIQALVQSSQIVLIDGHQMALSQRIATIAKRLNIPVVIDAGSWKPGFETVLPLADVVIASANFRLPNATDPIQGLKCLGVNKIAITQGAQPIFYQQTQDPIQGEIQEEIQGEISVPTIQAVDTLGAGDIFHGAFCYFYQELGFLEALRAASKVAAFACQYWGTRAWLDPWQSTFLS
jgi:sugar/nucleoside kinase (ribokinase family)